MHESERARDKLVMVIDDERTVLQALNLLLEMWGYRVVAAESDDEARRLATSQQMSFTDMFRGKRGLFQPPIDNIESYWNPLEKAQAGAMLELSVIGGPATVRAGIDALLERTRADELIVVSDVFDPDKRRRSFEILAEVCRAP